MTRRLSETWALGDVLRVMIGVAAGGPEDDELISFENPFWRHRRQTEVRAEYIFKKLA